MYKVTFAAGAHTHSHIHPNGQGPYVTAGVAVVHVDRHPPVRLGPGEHVWIGPDQRRWHGDAPERAMTHITFQKADADGATICRHEPVTDIDDTQATQEKH